VANAIAWIGLAPMLDIIVYAEPASKVFIQGIFAFIGDIIIIGVLGTLLLVAYSKVAGKSSSLKKED
jgi:energy-coupling factor transport system substrate-specific component